MKKLVCALLLTLVFSAFVFSTGEQEQAAAEAEPQKLVVWCHSVHQQVAEGTRGGAEIDITEEFKKQNNVELEWVTIPWNQMQNKILRELSIPTSTVDLVFIVQDWATPTTLGMLESLDPYMKRDPIEDFQDVAPGMVSTFTLNGAQKAVPYRSNPQLLHYNKKIFEQRGLTRAPKSFEELVEFARKTTYTRSDGAEVYGLGIKPDEDMIAVVRAYGGEVLSKDFEVQCNKPEAVKAIEVLRELYNDGAIPPNFAELASTEYQSLVAEGLVAMVFFGDNYHLRFNDPEKSKEAGNIWFSYIPASIETGLPVAPSKTAFWAVGIPSNSSPENRELSWQFIKFVTSKDSILQMALNGNGPVRTSVFENPRYSSDVPYAAVDAKVLATASPLLPIFEGTTEVRDIFREEATMAIIGQKDVQKAMDDAAAAIEVVVAREGVR